MKLTHHATQRGNERLGLPLKPFEKLAAKALAEGIKHSDTNGRLKKYFDKLFFTNHISNVRIYGEFVYLFKADVLITVLNLPNDLKAIVAKVKQKTKN